MASDVKAGAAYIRLYGKDEVSGTLKSASSRLKRFGWAVSQIGRQMAVVGGAATAGLVAGLAKFAKSGGGKEANQFATALKSVRKAMGEVGTAAAKAVAPALTQMLKQALPAVKAFRDWVKLNPVLVRGLGLGVLGFTSLGGAIAASGKLISAGASALSIMGPAIAAIVSPIGLATAAAVGLGAAWLKMTDTGQEALGAMTESLGQFKRFATGTFQAVSDALSSGNLALVGKIAFKSLELVVFNFKSAALDIWADLRDAMANIWTQATTGFALALNVAFTSMQTSFGTLVTAATIAWNKIKRNGMLAFIAIRDTAAKTAIDIAQALGGLSEGDAGGLRKIVDLKNAQDLKNIGPDDGGKGAIADWKKSMAQIQEDSKQRAAGIIAGGQADVEGRNDANAAGRDARIRELDSLRAELRGLQDEATAAAAAPRKDLERIRPNIQSATPGGTFNARAAGWIGNGFQVKTDDILKQQLQEQRDQKRIQQRLLEAMQGGLGIKFT